MVNNLSGYVNFSGRTTAANATTARKTAETNETNARRELRQL
ncbi:MAG: hypothetical protein Q4E87_00995 [bacterium]|nr:hypothetical protein [bacterium]